MAGINKRLFFKDFGSNNDPGERTVKIDFDPNSYFDSPKSEEAAEKLDDATTKIDFDPYEDELLHEDVTTKIDVEEVLKELQASKAPAKEEPVQLERVKEEPKIEVPIITKAPAEMKKTDLRQESTMNTTSLETKLAELRAIRMENMENLEKVKDALKAFENTHYENIVFEKYNAFLPKLNSYNKYLAVCEKSLENVIENMKGLDAFSEF